MSWVYGVQAVEALLQGEPDRVHELWLLRTRRPGPAREKLRAIAQEQGVRFRLVEADAFKRELEAGAVHQGVAAKVSELAYLQAGECLAADPAAPSLVIALDRVQDPRNLGSIVRSSAAFGADSVVIPKHRAAGLTPAAVKAAAGGLSKVKIGRATNLARFLEDAKAQGYWICAADAAGDQLANAFDWPARTILLLGAEGDGIRAGLWRYVDFTVRLPMVGMESLNVAVAAGILIHGWASKTSPSISE